MAKCDEGYLCDVCGQDVAELTDSDLYLRYIVGMLDPEVLHTTSERHIRCNPTLAQYIVADDFEPVVVAGPFDQTAARSRFRPRARTTHHARLEAAQGSRRPGHSDHRIPAAGSDGENQIAKHRARLVARCSCGFYQASAIIVSMTTPSANRAGQQLSEVNGQGDLSVLQSAADGILSRP